MTKGKCFGADLSRNRAGGKVPRPLVEMIQWLAANAVPAPPDLFEHNKRGKQVRRFIEGFDTHPTSKNVIPNTAREKDVATLLLFFLKSLPYTFFPSKFYATLIQISKIQTQSLRVNQLSVMLQFIPEERRESLILITSYLRRSCLPLTKLAETFKPFILKPPKGSQHPRAVVVAKDIIEQAFYFGGKLSSPMIPPFSIESEPVDEKEIILGIALADFSTELPGVLGFKINDKLTFIEQKDEPGWVLARNSKNVEGYAPVTQFKLKLSDMSLIESEIPKEKDDSDTPNLKHKHETGSENKPSHKKIESDAHQISSSHSQHPINQTQQNFKQSKSLAHLTKSEQPKEKHSTHLKEEPMTDEIKRSHTKKLDAESPSMSRKKHSSTNVSSSHSKKSLEAKSHTGSEKTKENTEGSSHTTPPPTPLVPPFPDDYSESDDDIPPPPPLENDWLPPPGFEFDGKKSSESLKRSSHKEKSSRSKNTTKKSKKADNDAKYKTSLPPSCPPPDFSEMKKSTSNQNLIPPPPIQEAWKLKLNPDESAKLSSEMNKRFLVFSELVKTEGTYLNSLKLLNDLYFVPFKENPRGLTEQQVYGMFSNLDFLLKLHKSLFEQFREAQSKWNDDSCVGNILVDACPKLKLYHHYVENHENAMSIYQQGQKIKMFAKFVEELDYSPALSGLCFESLLICPIQRVPRYVLLIQDLLKHTPRKHPDYPVLYRAFEIIQELAINLNAEKRKNENIVQLNKIQERFEGYSGDLAAFEISREFINESSCFVNKDKAYVFFFTDSAVVTKKSGNKFQYKKTLSLERACVTLEQKGVQVLCDDGTVCLIPFAEEDEKGYWIRALSDGISSFEAAKKAHQKKLLI